MSEFKVRAAKVSEHNFVLATFVNGYVRNNLANLRKNNPRWMDVPPVLRNIPPRVLCDHYHSKMEERLASDYCLMVTDPDDVILLGYVVFNPNELAYLYVKPEFKNEGIEELLLNSCGFRKDVKISCPFHNTGFAKLLQANGFNGGCEK